jgi:uncharacterized peroxidase-related enzyme
MEQLPISQLPMMAEQEATGEVAEVFDDLKREFQIPFVPNLEKTLAVSPPALKGTWEALKNVLLQTSLPMPLKAMILFSVASMNKCQYCNSIHKVTCRTIGIDEETLAALDSDLEALAPRRVQEIVKFAQKCAGNPLDLGAADYDAVRQQGVGDEEIVEIITLAALGNFLDTLADSLKLEVDSVIADALRG